MKPARASSQRLLFTASAAALCALNVFPACVSAATLAYTVTDLGTLFGGSAYGYGINASGQVAGESSSLAVRWTGTVPANLGTLNGSGDSYGYSINASGQIAGISYTTGGSYHAVRWTGTTAEDLGIGFGYGINDSGQIAGINSANHAVRWTGTTPTDLGTLGGSQSEGYGINASGQVAGNAQNTGGYRHAVRWTGTTPTDLGTLDGTSSEGYAINASGQVAGLAAFGNFLHAVRWTGTALTDLGTLGGTSSQGFAINTFGDVTGMSFTIGDASYHPFLYTGGLMYDLSTLLLPGSGVTGLRVGTSNGFGSAGNSINDLGQIAAYGTIGGQQHALRLDPVATPEPASVALLLGGCALLSLRRRRSAAGI